MPGVSNDSEEEEEEKEEEEGFPEDQRAPEGEAEKGETKEGDGEEEERKGEGKEGEKPGFETRVFRLAAPIVSKKAKEVTRVTMDMLLRFRPDGYHIAHIHSD